MAQRDGKRRGASERTGKVRGIRWLSRAQVSTTHPRCHRESRGWDREGPSGRAGSGADDTRTNSTQSRTPRHGACSGEAE